MKFCPHCSRWNIGTPARCRYCGRTWGERICSAGHVNPADANFCGECGRAELSEPAGRTPLLIRTFSLIKPISVGLLILVGIVILVSALKAMLGDDPAAAVLSVAFLIIALIYSSRFLGFNIIRFVLRKIRNARRFR